MNTRRLGIALPVVISISLGIGITVAAISFAAAFEARSLPFSNHDVVAISEKFGGIVTTGTSLLDLQDLLRNSNDTFSQIAVYTTYTPTTQAWFLQGREPRKVSPAFVSHNFFDVLGAAPIAGQGFSNSVTPEVMLSEALWRKDFGADPTLPGKEIILNNHSYRVTGIIAQEFDLPQGADVWIKHQLFDQKYTPFRTNYLFYGIGTLRPGVTLAKAQAFSDLVSQALQKAFPQTNQKVSFVLLPLAGELQTRLRSSVKIFYLLSISLLVIIWINSFTLILARQVEHQGELSIRIALGTSHAAILGKLSREIIGLAATGVLLGGFIGWLLLERLKVLAAPILPRYVRPHLHWEGLLVSALVTLLAAFSITIYASRNVWRMSPAEMLRNNASTSLGRGALKGLKLLLAMDMGVTTALVFCTVLFVHQLITLQTWAFGLNESHVQDVEFVLPEDKTYTKEELTVVVSEILQSMQRLPGVEKAAFAAEAPFENHRNFGVVLPKTSNTLFVGSKGVTPGYFQALGIPILQGRDFLDEERTYDAPVCVLNSRLAAVMWPGKDALGKGFKLGDLRLQVVGIAGDLDYFGNRTYQVYLPIQDLWQKEEKSVYGHFYLRTSTSIDNAQLSRAATSAVPSALLSEPSSLERQLNQFVILPRLITLFASPIGLLAVLLSALGAFAIVAYISFLKDREIAIRLMLGATRRKIIFSYFRFIAICTIVGSSAGIMTVLLTGSLWKQVIVIPAEFDFTALGVSLALMFLLICCGTYVPIRRATKTNPTILMRGL